MRPELIAAYEAVDLAVLGSRLRTARLAAGLTQPEVAGKDASVSYLSRVESGLRRPNVALIDVLCERLGIAVEALLDGFDTLNLEQLECEVEFAEIEVSTGDSLNALSRIDALLTHDLTGRHDLRDRAYLVQARALAHQGEFDAALRHYENLADPTAQPSLLWLRATTSYCRLLRETGDIRQSIEVAEASLRAVRSSTLAEHEDVIRLAVTLGAAYYEAGDTARALSTCRRAVADAEVLDAPGARAAAYWNTAILEAEAGHPRAALELSRRALVLLEGEDDARMLARMRTQLGHLLLQQDPPEIEAAIVQLNEARASYAASDADRADRLRNQMIMGRAHLAAGDLDEAETDLRSVVDQGQDLALVCGLAHQLLGQVSFARGNPEAARTEYLSAIMHLSGAGADREAAQQWYSLGLLLDDVGLGDEAKDAFRRAAASTGLSQTQVRVGTHAPNTSRP